MESMVAGVQSHRNLTENPGVQGTVVAGAPSRRFLYDDLKTPIVPVSKETQEKFRPLFVALNLTEPR